MAQSNQKQDQDFQDELDVLQTVWVLGKQRGENTPLNNEQLIKLLDTGRLTWAVIGSQEKENLLSDEMYKNNPGMLRYKDSDTQKKQGPNIDMRAVNFASLVVKSLFSQVDGDFAESTNGEAWKKMNEFDQNEARKDMFRIKYGSYPDFFAYDLYQTLTKKGTHNDNA